MPCQWVTRARVRTDRRTIESGAAARSRSSSTGPNETPPSRFRWTTPPSRSARFRRRRNGRLTPASKTLTRSRARRSGSRRGARLARPCRIRSCQPPAPSAPAASSA
eukprot:5311872-Prymnesium_polylepis.1